MFLTVYSLAPYYLSKTPKPWFPRGYLVDPVKRVAIEFIYPTWIGPTKPQPSLFAAINCPNMVTGKTV
jgi:hypothetical protein